MPFFPQQDPSRPDLKKQWDELNRQGWRMGQLQTYTDDIGGHLRREVLYSYPGPVGINNESGDYLIQDFGAAVNHLLVTAKTAGSGDSDLDIRLNGTTQVTVTMPGGAEVFVVEDIYIETEEFDRLSVDFTSVGSGLASVVVHVQVVAPDDSKYT